MDDLLKQARHEIGLAYLRLGDMVPGGLCETLAAVERLLQHLEQREADMSGPVQVPTASTLQRYTKVQPGETIPLEPRPDGTGPVALTNHGASPLYVEAGESKMQDQYDLACVRAEAAQRKLAELRRAVHAYASLLPDGWSLHEIAKRYEDE